MYAENKSALEQIAQKYSLSSTTQDKLYAFTELLEGWSKKINLVSKADVKKIADKHIVDSLLFDQFGFIPDSGTLLDLGSGAGFPGLILAIVKPGLYVTLLDSQRKRALFLQEAISIVDLPNAKVVNERAEEFVVDEQQRFDLITARAVASLQKLWAWSADLLKPRGVVVAQKGGDLQDEILELNNEFDVNCKLFPIPGGADKKFVLMSA